jgi:serine phosphatase RsbU (regulator of sigma subunit)
MRGSAPYFQSRVDVTIRPLFFPVLGGLAMQQRRLDRRFLRNPVLLFALLTVLLQFPGARDLLRQPYSGIETRNLVVQNIDAKGPNASKPIRRNDEILSVAGTPVRSYNHFCYLVSKNRSFAPQEYLFLRGADSVAVDVSYTRVPSSIVHRRFGRTLVGFTFLLTGLLVLLRRSDSTGILFSLNCTMLCYLLSERPVYPTPGLQLAGELLDDAVMLGFPAVFLHFFLVFPERAHRLAKRIPIPRTAFVYVLPFLFFAASTALAVRNFYFSPAPGGALKSILALSTVYMAGYLVGSLIVFTRSYRRSTTAQKQKLRIAIAGTVVGMVPFLATIVWRQIMPGGYTFWEFLASASLAFVSISFAYAILKHGAIELNIVVRKSIVYAFLTGAVIAAYYGLVRVVGEYVTTEFNLRTAYFSIVAVLVLAVIFAPARQIVQGVVDRLFFRGDYDYRREVVEFNRQLSRKLKKQEILDYFAERMHTLLKASYVAFYKKCEIPGRLVLDSTDADRRTLPEAFPKDSLLGRYLSRYRKPLMVEYLDQSWGRRHLDAASSRFLAVTRAAVCLPIGSGESLFGLLVVGPKLSGLLYSTTDAELLETFSEHLGLVLENAELHEATIEQERLKNEVLLAREIQLALLPKTPPRHRRLELDGRMESSVEVGGDYYDFFELSPDRIGVTIGDVSGKGVPAAMLVASLQAVFKNIARRDKMSPAQVIEELNRYLCDNAKSGQYATIFYGIFELDESTFTFCNAGHCPVLLVRPNYADRLGEGGLVLGVEAGHRYEEGRVRIDPGDTLCFYTDGVTEQGGPNGQQYGEHRLIDFLRANRNLPLPSLQELLFASVLAFGNGRQDDDITTVIARFKMS